LLDPDPKFSAKDLDPNPLPDPDPALILGSCPKIVLNTSFKTFCEKSII
jgi:hypothetical protein